jgi:hypothetical protein
LEQSWTEINVTADEAQAPTPASPSTIAAKANITGVATLAAVGAQQLGVGATLLQGGAGFLAYSKGMSMAGSLAAYRPVQYCVARAANYAAAAVVSKTVCGISLGAMATTGTALLTAATVAQIGVGIHNTFIAKSDEEMISLNPLHIARGAFASLTGFGAAAAAA